MTDAKADRPSLDQATRPVRRATSARVQAWQDAQTRKALEEADAGEFATPEEVKATIRKFVSDD